MWREQDDPNLESNYVATNILMLHPLDEINVHCKLVEDIILKVDEYNQRDTDTIGRFETDVEFVLPIINDPKYLNIIFNLTSQTW